MRRRLLAVLISLEIAVFCAIVACSLQLSREIARSSSAHQLGARPREDDATARSPLYAGRARLVGRKGKLSRKRAPPSGLTVASAAPPLRSRIEAHEG